MIQLEYYFQFLTRFMNQKKAFHSQVSETMI